MGENNAVSILELLPVGEGNAISWENLAVLVGAKSKRVLQKMIERERNDGKVICASEQGGYYRPETKAEIQKYVQINEKKARSLIKALRGAKEALKEIDGQRSLEMEVL